MAPQNPSNAVVCVLLGIVEAFLWNNFYDPNLLFSRLIIRASILNIVLWLGYCSLIYPNFVSPLRHLPHPKNEPPIIGSGFKAFRKPIGGYHLKMIREVPTENGLIHYHGFFGIDSLFLAGPRAIADVFVHKPYDFVKPERVIKFLSTVLGDGLLLAEDEEHKFQRKKIMPSFSFRHVKDLYPIFWKKSKALVEAVSAEINENPFTWDSGAEKGGPCGKVEMNHLATLATFDIIGLAGLGHDFNTLKAEKHELVDTYEELLETSTEKAVYFAANMILPIRLVQALPWKMNATMNRNATTLRKNCDLLVQQKKAAMKTGEDSDHVDILSILLKSNDFSDQNLSDQLLTFLAAGHETTSSALTWTTYNLATHPEKQSKLRAELRDTLPQRGGVWNDELPLTQTLESLPYLNAVCNEVLRLFPTVPITIRENVKDTTIAGTFVPKGTRIFISPWAVNRSPHFWGADAEKFVPERWIDGESGKVTNEGGAVTNDGKGANYVNLTFLHGPRSCIGQGFAKSELRALVAAFVRSFEFELWDKNEKVEVVGVITTKPKGGMMLKVRETLD